ncbi:hypothetical protein FIBSPDRAFT_947780 [Athelia psychrophila]|uniref:Uncharacterized protein n=1 Tax=Athelia psychrophila TaxID=1759441 RepID=A0A166CKV4_9AGAM|nr:hypothetical protein FIBSPDRAFT_1049271 [Fibularhizoctonia sp. CBS 109695]KZP28559.1 hypothetical protein FIBSPDRAFT_947780 [Fibularhizoctonia sp. CBS 109695]
MATMGLTQQGGPVATSAPAATSSSFPSPTSPGGHAVALGVTLGVVALLIIGVVTYFIVRTRRARREQGSQSTEEKHLRAGRASTLLDARHPAARVTPFSNHTPGANMRVARRRQDGAWVFEEPNTPLTPNGRSEPSSPNPLSSAASSPRWPGQSKFAEAQAARDARRDTSGSSNSAMGPPPPAYHPEDFPDGGYIKPGPHDEEPAKDAPL